MKELLLFWVFVLGSWFLSQDYRDKDFKESISVDGVAAMHSPRPAKRIVSPADGQLTAR